MSKNYSIKAEMRERVGKGAARAIRREGNIPAVIYGNNESPITVSCPGKELTLEFHTGQMFTTLCDLEVDGKKHLVLARDIQLHPVNDTVEHVDFLRVSAKTKIAVMVPVQMINEDKCPSLDQKGSLNIVRHEIELVCQATNIPDCIEVDLTGFEHGDAVKVSNAALPEGTKPVIDDRDFTTAVLNAPKAAVEEEEEGEEGEEGAEGETAEAGEGEEAAAEE